MSQCTIFPRNYCSTRVRVHLVQIELSHMPLSDEEATPYHPFFVVSDFLS